MAQRADRTGASRRSAADRVGARLERSASWRRPRRQGHRRGRPGERIDRQDRRRATHAGAHMVEPFPDQDGGLGLHLVDRLADSWGVEHGVPGRVWFAIVTSGAQAEASSAIDGRELVETCLESIGDAGDVKDLRDGCHRYRTPLVSSPGASTPGSSRPARWQAPRYLLRHPGGDRSSGGFPGGRARRG